jgi:hypothetical protein
MEGDRNRSATKMVIEDPGDVYKDQGEAGDGQRQTAATTLQQRVDADVVAFTELRHQRFFQQ